MGTGNLDRKNSFEVTDQGSIILPQISNGAPSFIGVEREMQFGILGGDYLIYVWLGGQWRRFAAV
jgi:hypothetical protein